MLIHHDFVQEIVTLNTNTTQDCSALQIATITFQYGPHLMHLPIAAQPACTIQVGLC